MKDYFDITVTPSNNFIKGYPFKIYLTYPLQIQKKKEKKEKNYIKTISLEEAFYISDDIFDVSYKERFNFYSISRKIERDFKNATEEEKIEILEKETNNYLKKRFLDNDINIDDYPYKFNSGGWYSFYNCPDKLIMLSVKDIFKYLELGRIGRYIFNTYVKNHIEIDIKDVETMINKHIIEKFSRDLYTFIDLPYKFNIDDFLPYIKEGKKKENYPVKNLANTFSNQNSRIYSSKTDILSINKEYTILGIGGCGSNIVNYLAKNYDEYFNCLAIDANTHNLNIKEFPYKLNLQNNDLGCGGNFDCGYSLVTNQIKNEIHRFTQNKELIYIVSSISKGVGSGSTVAIIEELMKINKQLVLITILPFDWEKSNSKKINIKKTIEKIKEFKKLGLIILDNSQLETKYENYTLKESIERENKSIKEMIVDYKFKNNVRINTNLLNKI
ncbi:FtsZ/tubulin family protein [Aliarcobacter butzleri]|uniref:hypothetical protein n=1 Tax=Aliarcobacter butzleri TaxID=28197 RepID=UPI0021B38237|nr:hypothetical protein [Aliarcobacter butzleri]MCT7647676.1 hypothetical protein [Aliarcobacter butzleri]